METGCDCTKQSFGCRALLLGPVAISKIILDCANPQRLAGFWSQALGYRQASSAEPFVVLTPTDAAPRPSREPATPERARTEAPTITRSAVAEVVGVDLSEQMLAQARAKTPPELAGRVTFRAADAERVPFEDASFDLVLLANMIPFFDELVRVVAPGGRVVFSFSGGSGTPIWVPPERLRSELSARGFADFADFEAAGATALLARKSDRA